MKPSTTQQLRQEIQQLSSARLDIERGANISSAAITLDKSLSKLKPLMQKQTLMLENFHQVPATANGAEKEAENRRTMTRICDLLSKEMDSLLESAQKYFSLENKSTWIRVKNDIDKQIQTQRQNSEKNSNNPIDLLLKIMNFRDELFKDFLRSVLYRKTLLCKDLAIVQEGYIHSQHKSIQQAIEESAVTLQYVPTMPLFKDRTFGANSGHWVLNTENQRGTPLADILDLLNDTVEDLFSMIRNYSQLTAEQRESEDVLRNKAIRSSLRGEVERLSVMYLNLEQKYRATVSKEADREDRAELTQKLQAALEAKQYELKQVRNQFRDSDSQIISLKDKVAQLEADLNRVTKVEMKKLKQVETIQNMLNKQLEAVQKKLLDFRSIFVIESQGKAQLGKQIASSQLKVEKIVDMLCRQKQKSRSLQLEIQRLNTILIEAVNRKPASD